MKFLILALLCASGGLALAAENNNLVRQIDANTLQIGAVRLEKSERRLLIPATVNMVEGPIEYVLVSALGKLHEAIFKTVAEPMHVHTGAMLLLKEPPATNKPPEVHILVELNGRTIPVESMIDNTAAAKGLKAGTWRYLGSRLVDGLFVAQRDGSIVSVIADPDSIVQSGRVSAEDDENWRPRKAELPPIGTPLQVIFQFPALEKAR